jgi:ubiquinone/menaquinone biosynthesis C-methylase UbiE
VTDEDLNASAIYDAMAADYVANEDNPFNAYYEQPSVRALLPPLAGQRILDAGCGAGRATEWLTQQGAAPVGIDASAQMVRRARERFPGNSFVLANLAKPLPLEDASFDLVVASLSMHYLRDWVPTLREFRPLSPAAGPR